MIGVKTMNMKSYHAQFGAIDQPFLSKSPMKAEYTSESVEKSPFFQKHSLDLSAKHPQDWIL